MQVYGKPNWDSEFLPENQMKGGDGKDFQTSNECIEETSKRIMLEIFEICL